MYTPKHFALDDVPATLDAMRAANFVALVSLDEAGAPLVTHCPVVVDDGARHIVGHVARANPHWQALEARPQALVIFPGPHAYISPSLYASAPSVPTWNYIAVHARGPVTLLHEPVAKDALLRDLIAQHDVAHLPVWQAQPADYRRVMLEGIVGFEIRVERLDPKYKLSQNRPGEDRASVYAAMLEGGDDARALGAWMKRLGIANAPE